MRKRFGLGTQFVSKRRLEQVEVTHKAAPTPSGCRLLGPRQSLLRQAFGVPSRCGGRTTDTSGDQTLQGQLNITPPAQRQGSSKGVGLEPPTIQNLPAWVTTVAVKLDDGTAKQQGAAGRLPGGRWAAAGRLLGGCRTTGR